MVVLEVVGEVVVVRVQIVANVIGIPPAERRDSNNPSLGVEVILHNLSKLDC